ncbi:uncharacterized protein LOC141832470 [Curcuma longa]|uniref:uncharacterized protein LOC141832470 n=1 Tax=Curcuma longa TaxID=136217 RepID=UPI003D9E5601
MASPRRRRRHPRGAGGHKHLDGDGIPEAPEAMSISTATASPRRTARYHWILTIKNEEKNMICLLDFMGNKNQDDAWKTIMTNGIKMYNALRGILKGPNFKQLTISSIKNQCYNQSQYNEVRSEWSEFVYSYVSV